MSSDHVQELAQLRRLVHDLQSQVAFQEDTLASLDQVLGDQQREILLLKRQIELLVQRQQEQAAEAAHAGAEPPDQKPPHY